MYRELGSFIWHVTRQKAIWKDGDLWTGILVGAGLYFLFREKPELMDAIRAHFAEALTILGIVFGFVLATLTFYAGATASWSREAKVQRVARKLIDWHVWSVLCLLLLMVSVVGVWAMDGRVSAFADWRPMLYAWLGFLSMYVVGQILNHALTLWWAFRRREELESRVADD